MHVSGVSQRVWEFAAADCNQTIMLQTNALNDGIGGNADV